MSDNIWPTILPAPQLEGYGINAGNALLRTAMDSGAPRQRRVFSQVPSEIRAAWRFNDQEYDHFKAFHKYDLKQGQAWFAMDLKLDSTLQSRRVRFMSEPQVVLLAQNIWQVSAQLETLDSPVVSEEYYHISKKTNLPNLYAAIARYSVILEDTLTE